MKTLMLRAVRALRPLQHLARAAGEMVGLLPEDMVQGGLIDDADVTMQNCRFVLFDYQGKADPRVALRVEMVDGDNNIHEQFFSAAKVEEFAPSDDEMFIVAVGDKKHLNKGTNYEAFLASLLNEGFPAPRFREMGAASLDGCQVHVVRKPAPKRTGIINRPGQGDREQTQLVVSKILQLPGEKPKAGKAAPKAQAPKAQAAPKAAPKAQAAPAAPADTGGDQDADLMPMVVEAITEAGGSIDKKALAMAIFRKATGALRKTAPKRVVEDDFLMEGATAGFWEFDGESTLTAA